MPLRLDFIHHTIFGSPSGWLLALTSVLSFTSRSMRLLISVCCGISTSRSNTVGVDDPTSRLSHIESVLSSLHTTYAYLTALLLTLMALKYQGSDKHNPFSEHPTLMMLFLIAIFVYVIALLTLRSDDISDHSSKLMLGVCHISGALACELLLLVLVSPMRSLLINMSSFALILLVLLYSKYLLHLFHAEGTEISQTDGGEQQGSEVVNV